MKTVAPCEIQQMFLAIVCQVTHCYLFLHEHNCSPLRKDLSYVSPTGQNKLIDISQNKSLKNDYFCKRSYQCYIYASKYKLYIYIYIYILYIYGKE